MDGGRDSGAVDEQLSPGSGQQTAGENFLHRLVIADDGDDDVGQGGDGFQIRGGGAIEFLRERLSEGRVRVKHGRDGESGFLQAAGHVCPHAPDPDEANFLRHKFNVESLSEDGTGGQKCKLEVFQPRMEHG